MFGETLQKLQQQENFKKLHVLLHTGNLLTLNEFSSATKSAIPPQHYKEIFNVIQKDAK